MEKLLKLAARIEGLDPYERVVLVCLANWAGRVSHQCSRPVRDIAAHCGMSPRQAYRALSALRARGLLAVTGKTYSEINKYAVTLPEPQADDDDVSEDGKEKGSG